MKSIKLAAAALNQTPLDWDGNVSHILAAIKQAREEHVHVLCCPELCITGYGCEDAFLATGVHETALEMLAEIIPATKSMVVCVGLPVSFEGNLYSAAAVIADGALIGFAVKQNLAGDGLHYEPRWFTAWEAGRVAEFLFNGDSYPLGDLIVQCNDVRIGFEICEDAWVADRPGDRLATRGVDVILNLSASHFAFGKHQVRQQFILEGTREFQVAYVYANLLGNEAGRAIYDGDTMIASGGEIFASGPRFCYRDYVLTSAVVDVTAVENKGGEQESKQTGVVCCEVEFLAEDESCNKVKVVRGEWEDSLYLKEEEFARAIALGLFDYMRKSASRGFVVSLSGGADSAAVATLVALMVKFAEQDVGAAELVARLCLKWSDYKFTDPTDSKAVVREVIHELLWCVYQATRNSTEVTRVAAEAVADGLGAMFVAIDVDSLVTDYTQKVSDVLGRTLQWETDDLALQNIQARVRAPSVWLLANVRGALLLATSNRSEAAVGYTTMDGDTCGGIAPIAGIDKAFLRHWLKWMETTGPQGLCPVSELQQVNAQQPTAELRPVGENQTDESDLMPYEVLDLIERLAIRDKMMPREILEVLVTDSIVVSRQADRRQVSEWIKRFFTLWSRNQWKRERFAPSFHVDDENLDPKTWCRFPILSGGFRRELEQLD
jgi:NAD+ synthase (glutamine-hydrolysing)